MALKMSSKLNKLLMSLLFLLQIVMLVKIYSYIIYLSILSRWPRKNRQYRILTWQPPSKRWYLVAVPRAQWLPQRILIVWIRKKSYSAHFPLNWDYSSTTVLKSFFYCSKFTVDKSVLRPTIFKMIHTIIPRSAYLIF